jgi:hypothetical protein
MYRFVCYRRLCGPIEQGTGNAVVINIETTEGGAFGLAINTNTNAIFNFAAVDDITNSVIIRGP